MDITLVALVISGILLVLTGTVCAAACYLLYQIVVLVVEIVRWIKEASELDDDIDDS